MRYGAWRRRQRRQRAARRHAERFWSGPGRVSAGRLDIEGIERLARSHEQPVHFGAAEGHVRADLRQADLADPLPMWREDVHAVVAVADPAGGGPDIPAFVG